MRFVPASVLSLFLAFGFAACGPKVADRNIDALNKLQKNAEDNKRSLSMKEVEAVLGPPAHTKSFTIPRQITEEMPVVVYYYKENGQTIELHFVGNKLSNRPLHFGEKPAGDAELRKMPPRPAQ